jgi:hypothetical protein
MTNNYTVTAAGTITKEQTLLSIRRMPVAGAANIARGNLCKVDNQGYLVQAIQSNGTAGHPFSTGTEYFVALEAANNTSGTDAAITCPVAVRGHFVTVVAGGTIQPGSVVKPDTTAGQVVAFTTGTDPEGFRAGIYWGKEGGVISKSASTPYLESFTDNADFPPVACGSADIVEIQLI